MIIRWGGVDLIGLAQNRDKWRALLHVVITFGFHKMVGGYRVAAQLVASPVVLSSSKLVSCK
jgi:hypothetical protein